MGDNKKEFITDGLTNEEISVTISKIIVRSKDEEMSHLDNYEKTKKIGEEFSFFAERYPMLFQSAISDEPFPWDNLSYMLNMRSKIINNQMTAEAASKVVGQEWFDKFAETSSLPKNKKQRK
jgi:hypothetical protein